MISKEKIDALIPLLERNNIVYAGIFGSTARNEERQDSDIDLYVKLGVSKSLLQVIAIERELGEALGKKIDLVTEKALCRHIRSKVLNEMKVIYER